MKPQGRPDVAGVVDSQWTHPEWLSASTKSAVKPVSLDRLNLMGSLLLWILMMVFFASPAFAGTWIENWA